MKERERLVRTGLNGDAAARRNPPSKKKPRALYSGDTFSWYLPPRSPPSIHRLTYTPTPPFTLHRFKEKKTLHPSIAPHPVSISPSSSLSLDYFHPLPSSVFNLSHSHAARSPPTLPPASSLCQRAALNTRHLTRSPDVPLLLFFSFFLFSLDFLRPLT